MVVIFQNTKFACMNCQKGHRSQSCDHLHRILVEIKQKGRPNTQCHHCRAKRAAGTGHSHHKCLCGDAPANLRPKVEVKLKSGSTFLMTSLEAPEVFRAKLAEIRNIPITVHHKPKGKNEKGHDPSMNGPNAIVGAAGGDALQAGYVMTEWRAEFVSCNTIQNSFEHELNALNENPCKCHDGSSPCICSSLATRKSRSNSVGSNSKSNDNLASPLQSKTSRLPPSTVASNNSITEYYPCSMQIPSSQPDFPLYKNNPYSQLPYNNQIMYSPSQYIYNNTNSNHFTSLYDLPRQPIQPQQDTSDLQVLEGACALMEMCSNMARVTDEDYECQPNINESTIKIPPSPSYESTSPILLQPQSICGGTTIENDAQTICSYKSCCTGHDENVSSFELRQECGTDISSRDIGKDVTRSPCFSGHKKALNLSSDKFIPKSQGVCNLSTSSRSCCCKAADSMTQISTADCNCGCFKTESECQNYRGGCCNGDKNDGAGCSCCNDVEGKNEKFCLA